MDSSGRRFWKRRLIIPSVDFDRPYRRGDEESEVSKVVSREYSSWLHQQLSAPILVTRFVMMVLLFVSTIVLSVALWYATGKAYSSAVSKMNIRLREAIILRTRDYFRDYLYHNRQIAVSFGDVLENILTFLNVNFFTSTAVAQLISPVMWSFYKEAGVQLSALGLLQFNRDLYGYQGSLSTNKTSFVFSNTSSPTNISQRLWYRQAVDQQLGTPQGSAVQIPPLSLISSVSFIQSVLSGGKEIGWDFLTTNDGPQLLCVRAISRKLNNTVVLSGVTIVAADTLTLNSYLKAIAFDGATIFVQTTDGYLVATSRNVSNYDNSTGTVQLVNSSLAADSTVASAAAFLARRYNISKLLDNPVSLSDIKVAGKRSYISTMQVSVDMYRLLVVIVVTRDSIMGGVDSQRSAVLLVVCLASAAVLVLGWLVIIFVTIYVSSRMRPREELLRQQEETERAQAASEVKSQFLANISHDLRTPMAGILGLLDIMLCDRLTAEQEANLKQMKTCAASLLGLLNNLLDLAKVEAGKMQLEVLEFDIVGELESIVDMFSVQALINNTEVAMDLADDIERTVKGDPSRVRQVFANLLSNACKFTQNGQVLVRGWMQQSPPPHLADNVSVRTPASDSRSSTPRDSKRRITFVFEVDDTGPGIPPEKRDLVFEKFQQADTSTTRTHGGTGLGLGIVKSLVNLMGGQISMVDKDGPGACFRFDLTFECHDHPYNWRNSIVQPEFLLPKLSSVEGGQVLLAMQPNSAGAAIAAGWMERRGLHVWRVSQWSEIEGTVRNMVQCGASAIAGFALKSMGLTPPIERRFRSGIPRTFSASPLYRVGSPLENAPRTMTETSMASITSIDEEVSGSARLILAIIDASLIPNQLTFLVEELHLFRARLQAQGVVIAWLVEHNTTAETRRTLRRSGCAVASKPLHASRLAPLLALATARKGMTQTSSVDSQSQPYAGGSGLTDPMGSGGFRDVGSFPRAPSSGPFHSSMRRHGGSSHSLNVMAGFNGMQSDRSVHESIPERPGPSSMPSESSSATEREEVHGKRRAASLELPAGEKNVPESGPTEVKAPEANFSPAAPRTTGKAAMSAPLRPVTGLGFEAVRGGSSIHNASGLTLRSSGRTRSLQPNKGVGHASMDGSLKGLHVLIAEDTPLLKKVAVIRMQKLGCTVVAVSDGQEAVEAILKTYRAIQAEETLTEETKPFDAVLMDCQMPVLDGYGATAAIRDAEKGTSFHTPIIALTAHAMTSDERKCLDAGMDAYLTKPIDPSLMASTVLKLVKKGDSGDGTNGGPNGVNNGPLTSITPLNETFASPIARTSSISRTTSEIPMRFVSSNSRDSFLS